MKNTHRGFFLLCILATLVGLVSLRYVLPHIPFPVRSVNLAMRRPWLVTHAAAASIALLVGPWQFLTGLRISRKRWHRCIGWLYMIAVLIGWVCSIPVALHAQAGPVSHAGFLALGAAWILTTSLGLLAAINRQFEKHRRWMTRSFAVTCAAITLRVMLPISLLLGVPFKDAYPVIAWACWITNLCIAEYLLKDSIGHLSGGFCGIPHLANNERDMGHPGLVAVPAEPQIPPLASLGSG